MAKRKGSISWRRSEAAQEAFARSQNKHSGLMHRAGIANAGKTPPDPDLWISENYHKRVYDLQKQQRRILPPKYRAKIWKMVTELFARKYDKG